MSKICIKFFNFLFKLIAVVVIYMGESVLSYKCYVNVSAMIRIGKDVSELLFFPLFFFFFF